MKYAAILAAGLLSGAASADTLTSRDDYEGLSECLKDVPTKWVESPDYEDYAKPFNLRLQYKPRVIVLPTTSQHVQTAVACAKKYGVKVQAKSGGHSYASFSSGGQDGSMMIDLEPFQDIKLDPATNIIEVGAGVRLGNLAQGAWDQGQRGLSHGTCPGVGIGGHFTHGGYGHTSRNWGLALDHIVGLDLVLANGTFRHATPTEYSDIYWACRGACESFAVVTKFYLETHEAPKELVFFQYQWPNVMYENKQTFIDTFLHIQEVAQNDTIINEKISWGTYLDGVQTYQLSGTYFGSAEEFKEKINPEFLRTLPTPNKTVIDTYDWIGYLTLLSDKDTIKEPLTGYDEHDNFFAKSVTVPETDGGLGEAALGAFWDHMHNGAPTSYFVIINLYGGPGSNINSKGTDFAAYNRQNSLWVFQNYGETAESIPFINGINDAIINAQPQTEFGAYLNYVDPSYDAATAHKLYYGEELYAKLLALKKQLDPEDVFWNPQAIGN